jgi:cytochrome c oxidase subunit 4
MEHAPSSWVRYLAVWLTLLALTGLSFLLSLLHLGPADAVAALGIAAVKTALVGLFFMHLVEARFSVVLVPLVALFLLLLLLSLVVTDVTTRQTFPPAPAPDVDELPALPD